MAAVHGAGLVHRDIKAQNVMREEGGRVVLMDFGAGRSRDEAPAGGSRLTGTPLYLAPEVLNGGDASIRSDIYSLGVLLYYLVTGDYPVRAASLEQLKAAHRDGSRVRLLDARSDLPAGFIETVERAIEPDPQRRFESVGELQSWLREASGDLATRPSGAAASARLWARVWSRRSPVGLLAGLAALCVLAVSVVLLVRAMPAQLPTIAVLPLRHSADVPAYVADDLRRRVVEILGASKVVKVVSVDSRPAFTAGLAAASGRPWSVQQVLDGEITPGPLGFKTLVRLRPTPSADATWQHSIEGSAGELPLRIATTVIAAIRPDGPAVPRARSPNDSAADFDARGRFAIDHGSDRAANAIAMFKKAIEADPGYARAYAGLSKAHMMRGCRDGGGDAKAAAQLAVALDATSAEAQTTLADVLFACEWNWGAAEATYRTALALNPSDEYTRIRYAMFLASGGSPREGLQLMLRGRDADAMSAIAAAATAHLLYCSRRFDDAQREIVRAIELDDRHATAYLVYGRILSARGRFVEASRVFAQATALDPVVLKEYFRAEIAAADAGARRVEEARGFVQAVERDCGTMPAEMVAFVYARLGATDDALRWLELAVDERSERVLWLRVDPRADPLRADPRFAALLTRLPGPPN